MVHKYDIILELNHSLYKPVSNSIYNQSEELLINCAISDLFKRSWAFCQLKVPLQAYANDLSKAKGTL